MLSYRRAGDLNRDNASLKDYGIMNGEVIGLTAKKRTEPPAARPDDSRRPTVHGCDRSSRNKKLFTIGEQLD